MICIEMDEENTEKVFFVKAPLKKQIVSII